MRYNQIRECDIVNGEGIGIALFVQGCHFKCNNCFNPDTWDFNCGKEWVPEVENKFIELANRPYIKRISVLGGEPLADENTKDVCILVDRLRILYPEKKIWLYTGYSWREIFDPKSSLEYQRSMSYKEKEKFIMDYETRQDIVSKCDVLVDGRYVESLRDTTLKWRGSTNQRVIDVQESLKRNKVVLHCD